MISILSATVVSAIWGWLFCNFGPLQAALFLGGLLVVYFFLEYFERMFLVFLVVRPVLDMFQSLGIGVGYSVFNPAALVSMTFILCAFLHFFALKKRFVWDTEIILFSLFLGFSFCSTLVNFKVVGMDGVFSFLRLAAIFFIIQTVISYSDSEEKMKKIRRCLEYSLVLPVAYAIAQIFTGINVLSAYGFKRINGGFAHPNVFAEYAALFIIYFFSYVLSKKSRRLSRIRFRSVIWVVVLFACLVLTYARGPLIALIVSLTSIACFYYRRRFVIFLLLLGVGFGGWYFFTGRLPIPENVVERFSEVNIFESKAVLEDGENSLGWRILYWKELLTKYLESPVLGFGLGSVVRMGSAHMEAHNNYIQILFEAGMGAIAYFSCLFVLLFKNINYLKNSKSYGWLHIACIGILIHTFITSFGGHLLRNTVLQTYFFTIFMLSRFAANYQKGGESDLI